MRISDWSSDVCSSDLAHDLALWLFHNLEQVSRSGSTSLWEGRLPTRLDFDVTVKHIEDVSPKLAGVSSSTTRTIGFHPANVHVYEKIGRESCGESVCQ